MSDLKPKLVAYSRVSGDVLLLEARDDGTHDCLKTFLVWIVSAVCSLAVPATIPCQLRVHSPMGTPGAGKELSREQPPGRRPTDLRREAFSDHHCNDLRQSHKVWHIITDYP